MQEPAIYKDQHKQGEADTENSFSKRILENQYTIQNNDLGFSSIDRKPKQGILFIRRTA